MKTRHEVQNGYERLQPGNAIVSPCGEGSQFGSVQHTSSLEFTFTLNGRAEIKTWSRTAEFVLGYGSEVIGRPVDELLRLNAELTYLSGFFKQAKQEGVVEATWNFITSSGRQLPCSVKATAMFGRRGSVDSYACAVCPLDEPDSRTRERPPCDLLNELVSAVDEYAIVTLNPRGLVTSWNPGAERIHGYFEEEVLGKPVSLFCVPEDSKGGERLLEQAALTGRARQEGWRIRKNGERFWADLLVTCMRNSAGEIIGYGKITRDITKRKQMEDALRKSAEQYKFLAESMPHIVWRADANGQCTYVNRFWAESTDSVLPLNGTGFREEFVHPEDFAVLQNQWQQSVRTGEPLEVQGRFCRSADGVYRWQLIRAHPYKKEGGEIVEWVGTATDIHDQKMAEQELVQIRELLELRVKQRTDDLERANKELEAFSYSVSHDLKSPLRAIRGFGEILLEEHGNNLSEVGRSYLVRMVDAANKMTQLIQDLLEYSKAAPRESDLQEVPLEVVLEESIEHLQEEIERSGATIHLPKESPVVEGHPTALIQIFSNLLSNAIKYVARGVRPVIRVSVTQQEEKWLKICVQDNGIGIAEHELGRIFQPFTRLHTQKEYSGSGLGLAIVQKAIRAMGGSVELKSAPGQGSTFCLRMRGRVAAA